MTITDTDAAPRNLDNIVHPETRIGHVHLKVSDIDRALAFYRDLLGFQITVMYGNDATFLSAGGYHHHIGLNAWESKGGTPSTSGQTGLYHFAILYPNRLELARALKKLMQAKYPITGTADHGVSEAIYLNDPDNNGVELYADRSQEKWPRSTDGSLKMGTWPLELKGLMSELDGNDR